MASERRPPRHPRGRQVVRRHARAPRRLARDPGRLRSCLRRRERSRQVHARQDRRRRLPARPGPAAPAWRAGARSGRRARRSSAASRSSPRRSRSSRSGPSPRTSSSAIEPRRFGFVRRRRAARPLSARSSPDAGFEVPADARRSAPCRSPSSSRSRSCGRSPATPSSSSSTSRPPRSRPPRSSGSTRSSAGLARRRPDRHPRVALPRRGPRARRHDHRSCATARSSGPGPACRRDRGHARRGDARPVDRADLPAEAGAGRRRAGRAERPGPHGRRASRAPRSRSAPARSSRSPGSSVPGRSELARAIFGAVPATSGGAARRAARRSRGSAAGVAPGEGRR